MATNPLSPEELARLADDLSDDDAGRPVAETDEERCDRIGAAEYYEERGL